MWFFWMALGSYFTFIVNAAYGKVSDGTIDIFRRAIIAAPTIALPLIAIFDPLVDKSDLMFMAFLVGIGVVIGYAIWVVACFLIFGLKKLRDLRNWIVEIAILFRKAYRQYKKKATRTA